MIRLPSWFEFLLGIIALFTAWQDAVYTTNLPSPQAGCFDWLWDRWCEAFSIQGVDEFFVIDDATKVVALALRDDCEVEV